MLIPVLEILKKLKTTDFCMVKREACSDRWDAAILLRAESTSIWRQFITRTVAININIESEV